MYARNWEDFVQIDADGRFVTPTYSSRLAGDTVARTTSSDAMAGAFDSTHPTSTTTGSISGAEPSQGDVYLITLVGGQTYSFDYRGTAAGGIVDPFLAIFNSAGNAVLASDDDGGNGISAQITFTPTTSGTYLLYATTWDAWFTGVPSDTGGYTIASWTLDTAHDAPGTLASTATLAVGTNYANLDAAGDIDVYKFEVAAGQVYSFGYSGGVGAGTDWDFPNTPGESIGYLQIVNSLGQVVSQGVNYDTSLTFIGQTAGTYYLRVSGYESDMTGGYTLDYQVRPLSSYSPLESLNWDSADNIDTIDENGAAPGGQVAYVYFGAPGENFGEAVVNQGWQPHQIAAVMSALGEYTPITGIEYRVTNDVNQAEFRMITVATATYGARFYPQDPAYGTQQGIGTFNLDSGGFGAFPQSLEPGGYAYAVILHEFGHAHGIAHPHDTGGGSEVMLGVTAAQGSFGLFNLNQGVYTVMSYNDAWQFHPDGPSAFTIAGIDNGWSSTLGAFDIAVLQARYGVHAYNATDTVYALTDIADDANYQTIWDSGGNDTIAYGGTYNAQIDLTAATLDYSPTGGGVLSFLYNPQPPIATNSFLVRGGYTIANGVVIENATGGSGNDVLIGNAANNVLTGNSGNDTLMGRDGNDQLLGGAGDDFLLGGAGRDTLNGGAGFDTASYRTSASGVKVNLQGSADGGDATGDRLISIEALEGSNFNDTLGGSNANDTIYGLGGNDLIESGNGNDIVDGGAGDDTLKTDNGNDTLFGGDGNDILDAGNGNDALDGGAGNDVLEGGNGNDVLNGGAGNDRLIGGNGKDLYLFAHAGADTIVGYEKGEKIDLSALGVTLADVTISATGILVNLDGEDLTIAFNTRGFSTANLVFDSPTAAAAESAASYHSYQYIDTYL